MLVRLVCWNSDLERERIAALAKAGISVDAQPVPNGKLITHIRLTQPSAIVIDLDRLPSHGREVGVALRRTKSTRSIPLVFLGGAPDKVAQVRAELPDATYGTWSEVRTVVRGARAVMSSPVIPAGAMERFAGSSLEKKLGLKAGMRVAMLGAPESVVIREDVILEARVGRNTELVICFIRSLAELEREVPFLSLHPPVWIAFPKQRAGIFSDFTQHDVRRIGQLHGLTDNKVCAIDATWSAIRLAAKRSFTDCTNIS